MSLRSDIVFVTARFRSGSTLIWNLFRNLADFTAYYEPFNERRWFDPSTRGDFVDATHGHVSEYWTEYEGLDCLADYFQPEWCRRDLLMDAGFWNPAMKRYIELLIEHAPRRPVLQFNRVDLRLPWLRRNFPNAAVIHLYRHPRDQWCSILSDFRNCSPDANGGGFGADDRFYLRCWARDLKLHFPFLAEDRISHPYQLSYFLWKLSYLFGVQFADCSIAFEELVLEPRKCLGKVFDVIHAEPAGLDVCESLIANPHIGKWQEYADDAWFKRHETYCETVLGDFLDLDRDERRVDPQDCERP